MSKKTNLAHIDKAYEYGVLKEGWTFEDYIIWAVHKQRYETAVIWGIQGSGKSSRMLQILFWVYRFLYVLKTGAVDPKEYRHFPDLVEATHNQILGRDQENEIWYQVLGAVFFKPSELVQRLEVLKEDEVIPAQGWDDVLVHFPSSRFKTDIRQYEAVDSTWAAIRTKVSVTLLTLPIIDRLPKNLKDNCSFELYLGPNQKEMIKRVFHLPGLDDMQSNFFKITVERPKAFDLYMVPLHIWTIYETERKRLTTEAVRILKGATNMQDTTGYVPVKDAAVMAGVNPNTIQQSISRGVYRGQKMGPDRLLHILEEDLNEYLLSKGKPTYTSHSIIDK